MNPPPFQKPIEIFQPPRGDWIEQPKLDGVAAAYSGGKLWSRSGKIFPSASFRYIIAALKDCRETIYGELWNPKLTLQEINGLCNHYRVSTDPVPLVFVAYDTDPNGPDLGYKFRAGRIPRNIDPSVWHVDEMDKTILNNTNSDGTIYRAPRGLFITGRPTPNILKLKNRAELDATVVGSQLGERGSKLEGMIAGLHCLTPNNVPFTVFSGITFDQATWYKERLPRKVKIKYQRLSDSGAPLSPVFLEEIE